MRIAILTTDNREQLREYEKPLPYFGTAPEALLQGFAMLPETEVHVVSCTRRRMESPKKLASNIFFHSVYVPKLGWMRTLFAGCAYAVRKKLNELQPDIVHGQGTERDCAINAIFSGRPNVLTIHGNLRLIAKITKAKPFSFPWLGARLESLTLPWSRGVVCITRYTQQAVEDLVKRTWIVPNAVDASFFEIEAHPPERPLILSVGLICPRKNQNAFIRALDPLAKRLSFDLLFLGSTWPGAPYDEEFFALVRERPWCRYEGFADREKLKAWLQKSTMVALPSLEDNCPMVVLEAMAAGTPVVAAKVGGVPDLIEDGKTGIFCDPLNEASMSAAVEKMLSDLPLARAIASNAKQSAKERFYPKVIAQRHVEIYREVLGPGGLGKSNI